MNSKEKLCRYFIPKQLMAYLFIPRVDSEP